MSDYISDDKWMKFVLICKPEQSGKTFIMIQEIIKDLGDNDDKDVVNFILCDNNLLLFIFYLFIYLSPKVIVTYIIYNFYIFVVSVSINFLTIICHLYSLVIISK